MGNNVSQQEFILKGFILHWILQIILVNEDTDEDEGYGSIASSASKSKYDGKVGDHNNSNISFQSPKAVAEEDKSDKKI